MQPDVMAALEKTAFFDQIGRENVFLWPNPAWARRWMPLWDEGQKWLQAKSNPAE
ncbi:MAG: hypothetical protein R2854_18325 [Caldilineaceae bacterium]